MGALYQSYNDVRLEKARVNQLVQQLDGLIANNLTGSSWDPGDPEDTLKADWATFLQSWNGFFTTGTDQASTLWFPNFPDGGEWAQCLQYETALAALQTRFNAIAGSSAGAVPVIAPSSSGTAPTPGSLFPQLPSDVNTTLTNALWIGGTLYLSVLLFPILFEGSSLGASYISSRRR